MAELRVTVILSMHDMRWVGMMNYGHSVCKLVSSLFVICIKASKSSHEHLEESLEETPSNQGVQVSFSVSFPFVFFLWGKSKWGLSNGLRGPAAILFTSRNACSDNIAKLCRACFVWGIAELSRDVLRNGVSHRCACVKRSTDGGVGGALTNCSAKKTIARYGASQR